jgi:hypothetical protein
MKTMKLLGAAAVVTLTVANASAERLFGLTADNRIVTFDSTNPGVTTSSGAIVGLGAGETLTGIDLRPANNVLYTLATSGNLYSIAKNAVGAGYTATLVGPLTNSVGGAPITLQGTRFGFDFNPVPDRLRVITDFDQNLRINPANGVTIVDGPITGPGSTSYVGAAYTNNRAGATITMLYALDASGNQLALSSNPNAGTYNDIGVVTGVDFGGLNNVGFDISGRTGTAFFSNGASLYTINLGTAAATSLGGIGSGSLIGLTVAGGVPEPATWGLMILGFGAVGGAMRTRSARKPAAA